MPAGSKPSTSPGRARRSLALLALLMSVASAEACRSSDDDGKPRGLVVVNATATGVVRRVLVSEGAPVGENAVIVEIATRPETPAAPEAGADDSQARARAASATAQKDIQAVEAEVQRAAVEVQRVQQLVASGSASQAELDAARAQYQHAQEKLQRAKDAAQSAQRSLILQQGRAQPQPPAKPSEQITAVRVPSSGVVRVISVRAGDRVTAGQPIATVAADKR
ncbi:MAG TPA: hypothetical protein VJZ26_13125 [Blastocatellia bacterium]|nr:hypothetical protein [Blastocatellia bacterium]